MLLPGNKEIKSTLTTSAGEDGENFKIAVDGMGVVKVSAPKDARCTSTAPVIAETQAQDVFWSGRGKSGRSIAGAPSGTWDQLARWESWAGVFDHCFLAF